MADYAIGDVQGCYEALRLLLQSIPFNPNKDRLWFVGDLVNRGPDSLKVLRFIQALPQPARITLGNHDLHLLCQIFLPNQPVNPKDTLTDILSAPDKEAIGHWLRQQHLLYYDAALNCVMTHAGIPPTWTLEQAKKRAKMLENVLQGPRYLDFLSHMYGQSPNIYTKTDSEILRLRTICNYFTRMRFCDAIGALEFSIKTHPKDAPSNYYPWYALPHRKQIAADIIFGHWAALAGRCPAPHIHALDTGYVWGGALTAMRLQDKQRFSVTASVDKNV